MNRRSASFLALTAALLAWTPAAPAMDSSDALGSGRVVIVPLNLGVRATSEVEPGVEPVWHELLSHFAARQQPATALERQSAAALWNEVMTEVRAQPHPDVYRAYALFARRIADQVDYSAIVFPSLVTRAAHVQGETASWDGVRRHVALGGNETLSSVMGSDLLVASRGVRGEIAAASLHVAVLSPDGELRFEGAGGLSVLQQLDESEGARGDAKVAVALRQDAFADANELREGVEAAFRRPLPASRAH
ncbi:MAG TPA: hypothetical protein VKH41_13905 [Myxococcota bacterium]|nr:hypothetical protein [Myxococcota bacterium]